ncbi:MAG: hypothetical protein IT204_17565 [Fimbriimonadaceae bacterium]|nr:hypothetical protein [Fimbriimonadaceae bacterium]
MQTSRGRTYEGLAFTFCKAATVCLLCGRYALPVAAGAAAVLYVVAWRHGQRTTRCFARHPLAIAAFWLTVVLAWSYG